MREGPGRFVESLDSIPGRTLASVSLGGMLVERGWVLVALLAVAACGGSTSARPPEGEPSSSSAGGPFREGEKVPPEIASMLEPRDCQPRMRVAADKYQMDVKGKDGNEERAFLIQSDEKVCLLGEASGNAFSDLRVTTEPVTQEQAKQRLIAAELKMTSAGAVFVIRNHHSKPLRYRAVMSIARNRGGPTSVCPVMPGLANVEHWPHPVQLLMFGDFKLLERGEPLDCR
jgi:hypothetical protein